MDLEETMANYPGLTLHLTCYLTNIKHEEACFLLRYDYFRKCGANKTEHIVCSGWCVNRERPFPNKQLDLIQSKQTSGLVYSRRLITAKL